MPTDEPPLSLQLAGDLLKTAGLRKTVARVHLLQCLASQTAPHTQAEIAEQLEAHGFDSSTIFRGLTDLTSSGLVVRIDVGDRIWRFELRDRTSDGMIAACQHSHIHCHRCGRVVCLKFQLAECFADGIKDWCIDEFILRGRCPQCQHDPGDTPDAAG